MEDLALLGAVEVETNTVLEWSSHGQGHHTWDRFGRVVLVEVVVSVRRGAFWHEATQVSVT
jgi:hypothetical protein